MGFSHVHEDAEIKVHRGVALVGLAVYDATWGGGRSGKFINAENKIPELVDSIVFDGQIPPPNPDSQRQRSADRNGRTRQRKKELVLHD
jgi:hypothetical protein